MIFLATHVLNEIQNGDIPADYTRFLCQLNGSETLLTFNWDTLLDRALFETGQWSPDDGYAVPFESILDGNWRAPLQTHSLMPLHKLHGSTNWLVNYVTRNHQTGEREMVSDSPLEPGHTTFVLEPNFKRDGLELKFNWEVKEVKRGWKRPPTPPDPDAYPVCILDSHLEVNSYLNRYRPGYEPFSYFFPQIIPAQMSR